MIDTQAIIFAVCIVWPSVCLLAVAACIRWHNARPDHRIEQQRRKRSGQRNGAIGAVHGERNAANLDAHHAA